MLCLLQEMLDSLHLQLEEKHTTELASLQSSLALSFKEELQQVRHTNSVAFVFLIYLFIFHKIRK